MDIDPDIVSLNLKAPIRAPGRHPRRQRCLSQAPALQNPGLGTDQEKCGKWENLKPFIKPFFTQSRKFLMAKGFSLFASNTELHRSVGMASDLKAPEPKTEKA